MPTFRANPFSGCNCADFVVGRHKLRERAKCHETVWRPMEGRQGSRHDKRSDLAAVFEGLPRQTQLGHERAKSGQFCPGDACPGPAPTQSGSLFPWQQPVAPAPAPAPSSYGTPTPTGAGQFASAQEAQSRCPGATVVWVNDRSHIYHFAGTRYYGHTKQGAYMCEADAQSTGNRAAKNERHP